MVSLKKTVGGGGVLNGEESLCCWIKNPEFEENYKFPIQQSGRDWRIMQICQKAD